MTLAATAQSKWSLSLSHQRNAAINDNINLCIDGISRGICFDHSLSSTITTVGTRYQLSNRLFLNTGLGFETYRKPDLNDQLNTENYKLNFINIPIRANYIIKQGSTKIYVGSGIKLGFQTSEDGLTINTDDFIVWNNMERFTLSHEILAGMEISLFKLLSFSIEPTFAWGITNFTDPMNPSLDLLPGQIATSFLERDQGKPHMLGINMGLNYRF